MSFILAGILAVFLLLLLRAAFRRVPAEEQAVIYSLGRYSRTAGPGLVFLRPVIDSLVRVNMQEQQLEVRGGDIPTRDRKPCGLDAAVRFVVVAPDKAVNNVADYRKAVAELTHKILTEAVGKLDLGDIPASRDRIAEGMRSALGPPAAAWGIQISVVILKSAEVQ